MIKRTAALLLAALLLGSCGQRKAEYVPDEEIIEIEEIEDIEDTEQAPETEVIENLYVQESPLSGKLICIDPGHCVFSSNYQEPMAPGSGTKKSAFVSGTAGAVYTEEQLNLIVGLKLEERLINSGATVIMTRRTAQSDLSNVGRAQLANEAGADLVVRLHADGSENHSVSGMSMLIPTSDYISDPELIAKSRRAGELILQQAAESTGARSLGLSPRSDMTGFNWSEVPVVLLEMGFMTNAEEDRLLSTEEYQDKIVDGIVSGLELYFAE